MNEDLNFSSWVERRKEYFGPFVDHTLREVRKLEAEVTFLREANLILGAKVNHICNTLSLNEK